MVMAQLLLVGPSHSSPEGISSKQASARQEPALLRSAPCSHSEQAFALAPEYVPPLCLQAVHQTVLSHQKKQAGKTSQRKW